jgi:hypothetical protein
VKKFVHPLYEIRLALKGNFEKKHLPMTGMEKVGGLWGKLIERRAIKYKCHINGQLPNNINP